MKLAAIEAVREAIVALVRRNGAEFKSDVRRDGLIASIRALDLTPFAAHDTEHPEAGLVERLRERARIRRQIPTRKSVQNGEPDRIADLLEEAAAALANEGPINAVPVDPMENWLMKPCLEWLEQAEHGDENKRCQMIASILRDLWKRQPPVAPVYEQMVTGNHSIGVFKDGKLLAADADVYTAPLSGPDAGREG